MWISRWMSSISSIVSSISITLMATISGILLEDEAVDLALKTRDDWWID